MTLRTALTYVALATIWGSSFTLIKVALTGLSPSLVVLARLALGALALVVAVRLRGGHLPRDPRLWLHLTIAGVLGSVAPYLLLSYGEQAVPAGVAGALIGATPLLTLVLSAALRTERVSLPRVGGMAVGFAGVLLVVAPWHSGGSSLVGALLCLGAAACYAAGFVHGRYALAGSTLDVPTLAAGQLITATAVQAAVTPLLGWGTPQLTPAVVAAVAVLGVLGTGLAYLLYVQLIAQLGATGAASVDYLVPVAAVAVGVLALHEALTWPVAVGAVVVLAGVALVQLRWPARPARRPEPSTSRRQDVQLAA